MSDERPVHLLLDTSAIIAYCQHSIDVGEVITEVDSEDAAVGLPLMCLVEARRSAADPSLLEVLVAHPATYIVTPDPTDWRTLAAVCDIVGRVDTATALLAADEYESTILTGHPDLYAGLPDGGPIIEIPRS